MERERKRPTEQGLQRMRDFLKQAYQDGAFESVTARQRNAMAVYYGSQTSLVDVAQNVGLKTRGGAKDAIEAGLEKVWDNSSSEIQKTFPLDSLQRSKPEGQRLREKRSLSKGGQSIRIRELLEQGKTTDEIKKETGYTGRQISTSKLTLKTWEKRGLEQIFIEEENYETVQRLLDFRVTRGFLETRSKGENPLFVSIKTVAFDLYPYKPQQTRRIVESFKKSRIPTGIIPKIFTDPKTGKKITKYLSFILSKDQERARIALAQSPKFAWLREQDAKRKAKLNAKREQKLLQQAGWEQTLRLISQSKENGIFETLPSKAKKAIEIYSEEGKTFKDVARTLGLKTPLAGSNQFMKGLGKLRNSSPETQKAFPVESLGLSRPADSRKRSS